jgi:phosphoribosyl-AMP cyclohydrolase
MTGAAPFASRSGLIDIEETAVFAPKFDADGLIPAIAADAASGQVLMFAWMNAEALAATLSSGMAHFYSRSRATLWKKGETSGEALKVERVLTDCDQDVILIEVVPQGLGAACHTGRRACFYREVTGQGGKMRLKSTGEAPLFDPAKVYGKPGGGDRA